MTMKVLSEQSETRTLYSSYTNLDQKSQDDTRELTYWLTTSSTLLYLLQSTLKFSNTNNAASRRSRSSQATLFGRLVQGVQSSSVGLETPSGYSGMVGLSNDQQMVEAKYPALLFKQHLAAYVEKTYGMIRDKLKKEINPLLNLCIHAPRPTRERTLRDVTKSIHLTTIAKQQASYVQWQKIVSKLEHTLTVMAGNHAAKSPWDELQHIRQAVKFLVQLRTISFFLARRRFKHSFFSGRGFAILPWRQH